MNIIKNAKEISELIQAYNDQNLYEKIVSLREEIIEIREENISLKEKVKILEAEKFVAKELIREGNCYYKVDDLERKNPFCLACWDADRKLVSLIKSTRGGIKCAICSTR